MFQEDVAGAETIRSKLATVCWISFVVFIKIDCIHCSHLKSNSWDFTHVCDYSIIRCYSSSAVNVISSWRWNLCGVWSYCHLVFQKVTDSQIKSILFSGLVSVQSTWLEVCFLTTAIFFPFFYFCSHSDCCTASLHLWNMGKQHNSFILHLLQNNSTPRFVTPYLNITYAFGEDSAHSPKLTICFFLVLFGFDPFNRKT